MASSGKLPLRLSRTAHFDAVKDRVQGSLGPILDTLYMILNKDQRLGAKLLYHQEGLDNVVQYYLLALTSLRDNWKQENYDSLYKQTSLFIEFIQALFPNDRSRMVTVLRSRFGASFSALFKNSVALLKLMENGVSELSVLEPIDIPEQRASPIYTKVEAERLTLDSGHPLHPFLRKEGVDETRKYLRQQLAELSATLRESNVDRKYVEAFSKLVELIGFEDDAGAISFGLHVRLISHLTKGIEGELSDVLIVQIASTLTHSAYFASQYKDWVEFLHNAQAYPSRQVVETDIEAVLDSVASALSESSESVDERIPESIRFISRMLKGAREDRINAIYAGVRGLENICISTIKYAYEQAILFLQDAGSKARPTLVRLGAVAMIRVALAVISNSMPLIKNATELNWILENLPRIEKLKHILK